MTAREPKRAHLRVPALQTPPKFHERTPREEERMKIVAGEGQKRAKCWAVGRRGSGGGAVGEGVRRSGSQGERPNLGRTHENLEHTQHRHTTPHHTTPQQNNNDTPHNTTGGSRAGRSMARKTRHEQQIVPKSSPIGQVFFGTRMVLKGLGTKRFDQKKGPRGVWAKTGAGQKWSEKQKKKHGEKKNLSPSPKTKNRMGEKIGEKNLSSSLPDINIKKKSTTKSKN